MKYRVFILSLSCRLGAIFLLGVHSESVASDIGITVSQYANNAPLLSNATVDAVLQRINRMFRDDNPACDVTFRRIGTITKYTEAIGPASIDSESDFQALTNVPAALRIVKGISWCQGYGIDIGGCSSQPGPIWAAHTRPSQNLLPVIWAHEFGHTAGLYHRDEPNALMNSVAVSQNTGVNADECRAIAGGSAALAGSRSAPTTRTSPPSQPAEPTLKVDEFIARKWISGVPYALASRFTDADVPVIRGVLSDVGKAAQWSTAIAVLGAIGTAESQSALLSFLAAGRWRDSGDEGADAVAAVPLALGWLIAKRSEAGSAPDAALRQEALQTLLAMTDVSWWEGLVGRGPLGTGGRVTSSDLMRKGAIGLALSGSDEGLIRLQRLATVGRGGAATAAPVPNDHLSKLRTSIGFASAARAWSVTKDTENAITTGRRSFVDGVLQEHQKIKANGLAKYYSR